MYQRLLVGQRVPRSIGGGFKSGPVGMYRYVGGACRLRGRDQNRRTRMKEVGERKRKNRLNIKK